ncbi:MAG: serine protease [Arenicellales bacterium]|nr:serine protease [Arenicellales bacterium]
MKWRFFMVLVFFVLLNMWREWGTDTPDPRRPIPDDLPQSPDYGDIQTPLPESSVFDPEISIGLGKKTDSTGTAFALGAGEWWMTARHVVDQCARVQLLFPYRRGAHVQRVIHHPNADLSLLSARGHPVTLAISKRQLVIGQNGFQVGYPKGKPGEVWSTLLGRRRLRVSGRYRTHEPVVAWAENRRRPANLRTLGGLSGGPTLDGAGRVVGVLVAESRRRGRVYTAAPASINRLLPKGAQQQVSNPISNITPRTLVSRADTLRRSPSVAKVVCLVD